MPSSVSPSPLPDVLAVLKLGRFFPYWLVVGGALADYNPAGNNTAIVDELGGRGTSPKYPPKTAERGVLVLEERGRVKRSPWPLAAL